MDKLFGLFKIDLEETSEVFEIDRLNKNYTYLQRIIGLFFALQVILGVFHSIHVTQVQSMEWVFYAACLFLTATTFVVLKLGKTSYIRISMFLTLFLAAIYSWYGSIIDFGHEVYFILVISIGLFIVDSEGFRISSTLTGLIYLYSLVTQQKMLYLPDGQLIALIILLSILWYYSEHKHRQEIHLYNKTKMLEDQYGQLELEIDYRDALTERLMESEHKFRLFMNHVPAALIVLDQDKITYCNKSALQLTGYTMNELERMEWIDLIDYEDALLLESRSSNTVWEPGTVRHYTVRIINKNKKPIWTKLEISDLKFESRNVKLISGFDVSNQKHYETQLNKLVRMKEDMLILTQSIMGIDDMDILYDIILDGAIDSVPIADRGTILLVGDDGKLHVGAYRGYESDFIENLEIPIEESFLYIKTGGQMNTTEIINDVSRLHDVKLYDTQKMSENPIRSSICAPIYHNDTLIGMVHLDSPVRNAFQEEDYMIVDFLRSQIEMAINKQKLLDEAIYLSRYDKLTGVFNRRWFEEYYQTMERKAKRYNDSFALVMFDLNGLKQVNDLYGHLEGDALIKGFIGRLKELVRASDVLARFGGDEFVGVFHEINADNLDRRMKELADGLIENPIITDERNIHIRFSYGAAYFKEDSEDYETLVKIADSRMYKLKAQQEKTYITQP